MKARFDDLASLVELERICFPDPWSEKSLSQNLKDEKYLFLLERDEAGFALGYLIGWHVGDEAELARIAVLPTARGRGLGRKLLETALKSWRSLDVERVFLEVRSSNAVALNLYRTSGFERVATRAGYYDDGEEASIMRWELLETTTH